MKSLFNKADNEEIVARISSLRSDSKAQWGKMNVNQMVKHAQQPMRVAFGELQLKRTIFGFLFGKIAKKKLLSGEQWQKNLPTDQNFVITEQPGFIEEKQKLISLVKRFADKGAAGITTEKHPFFGKLTADEWARMQWHHLDHHLRQFGA